jgi:hypothetical protein
MLFSFVGIALVTLIGVVIRLVVISLRDFIRKSLHLAPIPPDIAIRGGSAASGRL